MGLTRKDRQRDFANNVFLNASFFKMRTTGSPTADAKVKKTVRHYDDFPSADIQKRFMEVKKNELE